MRDRTGIHTSPSREDLSTSVRWLRAARSLRGAARPASHAAFGALYALAMSAARATLRRFRGIDPARAEDLASEVILRALPEVIAAENPRAYYCTALRRAAISWTRRGGAAVREGEARPWEGGPLDAAERAVIDCVDARRRLKALAPRERAVLFAVVEGEAREAIAARLGTSRANVDQIVHRARARVAA